MAVPASAPRKTFAELVADEQFTEALALLEAAPPTTDAAEGVQLLRAVMLTNLGRHAEAAAECRLLLAVDDLNAGAHFLLGLCYEQAGQLAEAAEQMLAATYLDPAFPMAHLHRGLIARRRGEREAAIEAFQLALKAVENEKPERLQLFGGGFSRDGLRQLCVRELARLEDATPRPNHPEWKGRMTPTAENAPDQALHSAERLRLEFDRTFSEPIRETASDARDFVLVLAGGMHWALALDGLHGIEHDRPLIPMPSSRAALLGMAGVGSMAVPVFDLAALAHARHPASHPAVQPSSQPAAGRRSIFALLELEAEQGGTAQRVGVAFERLLQFARVSAESVLQPAGASTARPTLEHEQELFTILEPEELLSQIRAGASSSSQPVPVSSTEAAPGPREDARPVGTTK